MKKIFAIAVLALAVTGAMAEGQSQQTQVTSGSVAGSTSSTDGNAQNIAVTFAAPETRAIDRSVADVTSTSRGDQTVHYDYGTQVIKNVPSINGAALTTSNDTCMGSTSAGGALAGGGITFGTTWRDADCKRLKNARELWNMGMKGAAMALMCNDDDNRAALESTGYVCPQNMTQADREKAYNFKAKTADAQPVVAAAGEPTDPYIRARKGLPALTK